MAITDGLITLAEARASLGWLTADTANDTDLERYIEAATPVIENIAGPVLQKTRVFSLDGGYSSVALPVRFASVTSVLESGTATTDYVADPTAGLILAGSSGGSRRFTPGQKNIVVTVVVGAATIAPNVKLATRELVRHMWQVGRQAPTAGIGMPDAAPVPQGFAVPRRVIELLEATPRMPGFA